MKNAVNWIVDVSSGSMTAGPSENSYEGESATLSNGAKTVSCSSCSGSSSAGYLGGSSQGTVYFANVQSSATTRTTIRVKYINGDSSERFADISCNGGSAQRVAFVPSDDTKTPWSSVLNCNLNSGTNTVKITGLGDGSWAPDVDRLMVPQT
jgi:hypothetical protein